MLDHAAPPAACSSGLQRSLEKGRRNMEEIFCPVAAVGGGEGVELQQNGAGGGEGKGEGESRTHSGGRRQPINYDKLFQRARGPGALRDHVRKSRLKFDDVFLECM